MADAFEGSEEGALVLTKKKKIPAEAHGGAWKIAYADFVTAMMAFFLLLWLLNATTEDQLHGLSEYFAPTAIAEDETGVGEAMKGMALAVEGAMRSASSRPSVTVAIPTYGEEEEGEKEGEARKDPDASKVNVGKATPEEDDRDLLNDALAQLKQSIQNIPELAALQNQLLMEMTPEGLQIQLLDQSKNPMFQNNSPELTSKAKRLLAFVGTIIVTLPNKIVITGHTEQNDFSQGADYGNWELSGERASNARQWLSDAGLEGFRFVSVTGKADSDPLYPKEPESEKNRRVSILLLNESQPGSGG